MQFLHHPKAGTGQLILEGEIHRYLFKVRRHRAGESVYLRTLTDQLMHRYTIDHLDKRTATLTLTDTREHTVAPRRPLHIGWCMIDPRSIEKVIPSLNEIGVSRITFINCDRSQKNFRLDVKRLHKIILNSSQQCGRSQRMEIERAESVPAFLAEHPDAYLLHFSDRHLDTDSSIETVIIGCEGGFTDEEIALFAPERIAGLNTPMVLRSESAAVSVASLILL